MPDNDCFKTNTLGEPWEDFKLNEPEKYTQLILLMKEGFDLDHSKVEIMGV